MFRASPAPAPLALAAAALVAAGCSKMKTPWSARPGAGGAVSAAADTAAGDTAARAGPTDSLRQAGARGDTVAAPGGERPARTDSVPPDSVPRDSTREDSAGAGRPSVDDLQARGPTYMPYDVGPQLRPGDWLSDLLSDTLGPVVDRHDELSVEQFALFWVLVDRDGRVRDVVLHTTSRSDPFDQAARAVAERLRYRPALSDGEPVPVWVLARISLLMR